MHLQELTSQNEVEFERPFGRKPYAVGPYSANNVSKEHFWKDWTSPSDRASEAIALRMKSPSLQELTHQALSMAKMQLGNGTLESAQSRPKRTNECNQNGRTIMSVEKTFNFEGAVNCINNGALTLQKKLTISERETAISNLSRTYLTSTTDMDRENYCRVCLDQAQSACKCRHIRSPEPFVRIFNHNFLPHPSRGTNNRVYGRLQVRNCRFTSPSGSPGSWRAP